jgi:hypothetical protein
MCVGSGAWLVVSVQAPEGRAKTFCPLAPVLEPHRLAGQDFDVGRDKCLHTHKIIENTNLGKENTQMWYFCT